MTSEAPQTKLDVDIAKRALVNAFEKSSRIEPALGTGLLAVGKAKLTQNDFGAQWRDFESTVRFQIRSMFRGPTLVTS